MAPKAKDAKNSDDDSTDTEVLAMQLARSAANMEKHKSRCAVIRSRLKKRKEKKDKKALKDKDDGDDEGPREGDGKDDKKPGGGGDNGTGGSSATIAT